VLPAALQPHHLLLEAPNGIGGRLGRHLGRPFRTWLAKMALVAAGDAVWGELRARGLVRVEETQGTTRAASCVAFSLEAAAASLTRPRASFSPEAAALCARLQREARPAPLQSVRNAFERMDLRDAGVECVGAELTRFERLRELDLSGNALRCLEALPPQLQALSANANEIDSVELGSEATPSRLVFLSLSGNRLASLAALAARAPRVAYLDISYNSVSDLPAALAALQQLPSLRHLFLEGNPCCLLASYRAQVVAALPRLEALDGRPVAAAERAEAAAAVGAAAREVTLVLQVAKLVNAAAAPADSKKKPPAAPKGADKKAVAAPAEPESVLTLGCRFADSEWAESPPLQLEGAAAASPFSHRVSFAPSMEWTRLLAVAGLDLVLLSRTRGDAGQPRVVAHLRVDTATLSSTQRRLQVADAAMRAVAADDAWEPRTQRRVPGCGGSEPLRPEEASPWQASLEVRLE
jgi:hypothetical protein